jgi:hypothetical protein
MYLSDRDRVGVANRSLVVVAFVIEDLGPAVAVGLKGSVQVLYETSLRTGARLRDDVTELVLVLGDAKVGSIVLPVAVEECPEVEIGPPEGQLLELGRIDPAFKMLAGLQYIS